MEDAGVLRHVEIQEATGHQLLRGPEHRRQLDGSGARGPKLLGDAVLHGTPLLHPLEAAAGQGQRHEQEVDVRVFTHGAAAHRAVDRQRD